MFINHDAKLYVLSNNIHASKIYADKHSKLTYPVDHVLQTIPVCLLIDLNDVCNKHKIRHTCTGNSTVILLRIHHPDMTVSTLEVPSRALRTEHSWTGMLKFLRLCGKNSLSPHSLDSAREVLPVAKNRMKITFYIGKWQILNYLIMKL